MKSMAAAGGDAPPVSHARPETDERVLARLAAGGCRESFGGLVGLFAPRVFSLLRQRGLQFADAEDATQEAFAQAWRSLRTYDPTRPFGPWIFQIAVRCATQAQRKRRREGVGLEHRVEASQDAGEGSAMEGRETAQGVWELAGRVLSADQNTLLWLVYVEGLSGPDAARATGRTPVGVRVALHRARKRLEQAMHEGNTEGETP